MLLNTIMSMKKSLLSLQTIKELDRIAKMDQIFLKMAFAEILTISELPLKVSLNEYIEISKYYSTSKSKLFVNGLLDNFVKTYTRNGIIVKN